MCLKVVTTTQNTVQGMAKAWGTVDNQATNDSFNNSTDTDVGAGQFEHNFTNNFAAANYSSVASNGTSGSVRTFMLLIGMTLHITPLL